MVTIKAGALADDSHGVVRVSRYIPMQREGLIHADQRVEVLVDTPVLAVVDGQFGFGQTVAPQAVEIGVRKCKAAGLSAVALRNAGHIGRVSDWAEMAAAENLVSVHFVNAVGNPLVAHRTLSGAFRPHPTASAYPCPGAIHCCWTSPPR